jgi:hypothetical protein
LKHAEVAAEEYLRKSWNKRTLITLIRKERRHALSTLLVRCMQHPDAPAQTLVKHIHALINEGEL